MNKTERKSAKIRYLNNAVNQLNLFTFIEHHIEQLQNTFFPRAHGPFITNEP